MGRQNGVAVPCFRGPAASFLQRQACSVKVAAMIRVLMIFALLFRGVVHAEEGAFLNVALLELPDRFLADIPKSQRAQLIHELSDGGDDRVLSYAGGWLSWSADG